MRHTLCALCLAAALLCHGPCAALDMVADGIAYSVELDKNYTTVATVIAKSEGYTGDVVIPKSVTRDGTQYTVTAIAESAFSGCASLNSVTIPPTISYIGKDAFTGCSALTAVNIKDIGAWARIEFHDNPLRAAHNLYIDGALVTCLRIPSDITVIPGMAFIGAECIEAVVFPASLQTIGESAFSMCSGIRELVIPEPVSTIGNSAFYCNSALTRVWLPSTLRRLGGLAFGECKALTAMSVGVAAGTAVERGMEVFGASAAMSGTLYVPAGSLPTYQEKTDWAEWGEIVVAEKCATPAISLSGNNLTFTCETDGAVINASVTSADFGTATDVTPAYRSLTGVYDVKASAVAPGRLPSDVALANVAWSLKEKPTSPIASPCADTPLLFRTDGGRLTVCTMAGMEIQIFDLDGRLLHRQPTANGTTTISAALPSGRPVIIVYNNHSYKICL